MKRRLFLLLPLAAVAARVHTAELELAVIELKHRLAEELVPLLGPFAGPGGQISGVRNQLIVRATPENMKQIKQLVAQLDTPPRQLLITVRQGSSYDRALAGERVEGGAVVHDGEVSGRARVKVYRTDDAGETPNTQRVRVLEGAWAAIQVGQSIPIGERSVTSGPYGTTTQEGVRYRDVTTGMQVMARVTADGRVTVILRPRRNTLSPGGGGVIDTQGMDTTVSGKLGQWLDVGGSTDQQQSTQSGYVYSTRRRSSAETRIQLKVEEVQ